MTSAQMEKRLTAVEEELAKLKAQIASAAPNPNNWVEAISGTFANDPIFDEAMRLGRQWRKSETFKAARSKRASPRVKHNGQK